MNTKQFKQLIEESVRKVIKEELSDILKEAVLGNIRTKDMLNEDTEISFNTNGRDIKGSSNGNAMADVLKRSYNFKGNGSSTANSTQLKGGTTGTYATPNPIPEPVVSKNPYMKFFEETAANMSAQDLQSLKRIE